MKKADAIKFFGGTTKRFAEAIGCTRQNIYLWGDTVPPLWQYKIFLITDGRLGLGKKEMAELRRCWRVVQAL